jgi:Tetracyclin repressor-like, C-terminal domain
VRGTAGRAGAAGHAVAERGEQQIASCLGGGCLGRPFADPATFPELYRRYFEEVVTPRRKVIYRLIERGIVSGEIRHGTDAAFVNEILVGPILARMGSGATEGLDPQQTSRRIVDLVYDGIRAACRRLE